MFVHGNCKKCEAFAELQDRTKLCAQCGSTNEVIYKSGCCSKCATFTDIEVNSRICDKCSNEREVMLTERIVHTINSRVDIRLRGAGKTYGRILLAIGAAMCCPNMPVVFLDHNSQTPKLRLAKMNATYIQSIIERFGIKGVAVSLDKGNVILKYTIPQNILDINKAQGII